MNAMIFQRALAVPALLLGLALSGLAQAQSDPVFSAGPRFQQTSGEAIFHAICQGCHMPQAQGAKGAAAYPALAGDPRLAGADYPLYVVLNGQKGMPSFGKMLDDAQIAAVVGYVRTHFGNQYTDTVTAENVAKLRH
ncbi:cytochrome c [Cupriavidus basilensis]|uniref:Cytochrome c n=1 Tax=Cupriavidus basilensis TaxID=68895 RepID=A0ABT6AM49_9BURK|nr:cytochrome c [Cupriavidus basilensis]MDF3833689.1 cytochrome c [Cupriavidus basilensis]